MVENFNFFDSFTIFLYLVVVLGMGLYYARKKEQDTNEFFLAGRNLGWFVIGISLFATNISSEHFIGLAGSGATRGLAVAQFELIAIFLLITLGWFIAPVFKKAGISTTPEFLEKRFNRSTRKFFSGLSILTYVLTKILVTLFAGGLLFYSIFGWSIFTSAVIIVLITGVYSLIGGFGTVVRIQVFQGILLLIGAILLTVLGLNEVGGFAGLQEKLPGDYFQMFKAIDDPDFPWTGIFFGAPIIAFWYWCTDHYMVQRVLGSKSINDARSGTIFAAFLKILPLFILVIPGLIAFSLFPEVSGDDAFPVLVASNVVPAGLKGLVLVGVLSAIMSSLAASFNSISALYTLDFYKTKHPDASDRTLVFVGRMATIAVVVFVILLIPFVKVVNNQLYVFLQSTQAFISAPITSVFLFGLLFKKIDGKSALITLVVGEFFGISRLIIEFLLKSDMVTNSALISYASVNYLHFTIYLFVGSSILLFVLSYLFRLSNEMNSEFSIFGSGPFSDASMQQGVLGISKVKFSLFVSAVLLVLTLGLWTFFI